MCMGACYLVDLLPAVLIYTANLSMVMQKQLTAVRIATHHGAVVQWSQTPTVFIVRTCTEVQQCLDTKIHTCKSTGIQLDTITPLTHTLNI